MSAINEPLLYLLITLSTYYLVSGGINAAFVNNVRTGLKTPAMVAEFCVKGFIFVYYVLILGYSCKFMAVTLDPVPVNRTLDNEAEVTPIVRVHYLFAMTVILVVSFIVTQVNLYQSWNWGKNKANVEDVSFECPLGYEPDVVQTLGNRGKSTIKIEKNPIVVTLQLILFLAYVGVLVAINGGWYKPNGNTLTNWTIINLSAVITALVVLMVRMITLSSLPDRSKDVRYVDMLYMKRYGLIFHTNWQGQHAVWFLPQWFVLLMCTFELSTYVELFNDYPRVFFAAILTIFVPIMQALATHTIASWWYFSLTAKVFFLMTFWNATVEYPGFNPVDIKTAVPEGFRRWFYFLWDWDGNHTYTVAETLGVRYGLSVLTITLAAAGIVQFIIEYLAVRKNSNGYSEVKDGDSAGKQGTTTVSFLHNQQAIDQDALRGIRRGTYA